MMDGIWLAELARKAKQGPGGKVIPLRPELLPITGAVSDPCARTIDLRRYERRGPKVAAAGTVFALSLIAWGVIIGGLWALKLVAVLLWGWADASWVAAANLFLVLVAISLGAGVAWAGVTIAEAALLRWAV